MQITPVDRMTETVEEVRRTIAGHVCDGGCYARHSRVDAFVI